MFQSSDQQQNPSGIKSKPTTIMTVNETIRGTEVSHETENDDHLPTNTADLDRSHEERQFQIA